MDSDRGVDFDRLVIQQRRLIPPLAYRFDSRAGKLRINLAI